MERPTGNEPKSTGEILRAYREQAGLSQADLQRATGVKREYINAIERRRGGLGIKIIYPDKFNPLHDALGFAGFEMLEAMGYQTDAGRGDTSPRLLALIRRLTPEQQEATVDFILAGLNFISKHNPDTT